MSSTYIFCPDHQLPFIVWCILKKFYYICNDSFDRLLSRRLAHDFDWTWNVFITKSNSLFFVIFVTIKDRRNVIWIKRNRINNAYLRQPLGHFVLAKLVYGLKLNSLCHFLRILNSYDCYRGICAISWIRNRGNIIWHNNDNCVPFSFFGFPSAFSFPLNKNNNFYV